MPHSRSVGSWSHFATRPVHVSFAAAAAAASEGSSRGPGYFNAAPCATFARRIRAPRSSSSCPHPQYACEYPSNAFNCSHVNSHAPPLNDG
eukprot:6270-Pelagococcus_subviridis.AAC.3